MVWSIGVFLIVLICRLEYGIILNFSWIYGYFDHKMLFIGHRWTWCFLWKKKILDFKYFFLFFPQLWSLSSELWFAV